MIKQKTKQYGFLVLLALAMNTMVSSDHPLASPDHPIASPEVLEKVKILTARPSLPAPSAKVGSEDVKQQQVPKAGRDIKSHQYLPPVDNSAKPSAKLDDDFLKTLQSYSMLKKVVVQRGSLNSLSEDEAEQNNS